MRLRQDQPDMVVNGTCHHDCPDSCGWQVTVTDGVASSCGATRSTVQPGDCAPRSTGSSTGVTAPTASSRRCAHRPEGSGEFERSRGTRRCRRSPRICTRVGTYGAEPSPYSSAATRASFDDGFDRFFPHMGASRVVRALCGPPWRRAPDDERTARRSSDGAAPQQADHPLGDQHAPHEPPPMADDRGRPSRREPRDRDRRACARHRRPSPTSSSSPAWYRRCADGSAIHVSSARLTDDAWIREHTDGFDELAAHGAEDPRAGR